MREPVFRFFAQYEEQFVRKPPWGPARELPAALRGYHAGLASYKDYERVFCNMSEAERAAEVARRRRARKRGSDIDRALDNPCNTGASREDGTLARMFDSFVARCDPPARTACSHLCSHRLLTPSAHTPSIHRWDLRTVFDVHLTLQLASISQVNLARPELGARRVA